MLQIPKHLLSQTPLSNSLSQESKQPTLNWLLPLQQESDFSNTNTTIKSIPGELISENDQTPNPDLDFFQNDLRALQKYINVLPKSALQLLPEDEIQPKLSEFNQFFKTNYIDNQAFLLDPQDEEEYKEFILKNGFMTWQDFVIQKLNQKDSVTDNTDYQLSTFSQKTEEQKENLLNSLQPTKEKSDIPQSSELKLSYPQLDQQKFESQPFQSNSSISYQPSSYTDFLSESSPSFTPTIKQESLTKQLKSTKKTIKSPLTNPILSSNTNQEIGLNTQQTQASPSPKLTHVNQTTQFIDQKVNAATRILSQRGRIQQEQVSTNRQKGVNYAKIVGLASGGVLGGFSGLATMLSILSNSS